MGRPTIDIVMTKEQVIARLEQQVKKAEASDTAARKAYLADQRSALLEFRQGLKAALKWDAETADRAGYTVAASWELRHRRQAPRPDAPRFVDSLAALRLDARKTFRMSPTSDLMRLLAWDPGT